MIKIAICDDDEQDAQRALQGCALFDAADGYDVIGTVAFSNPTDLLAAVEQGRSFDLLLCDVYMPGVLGTEAVREMREAGNDLRVVFLTSSRDHAYEAFGLHADGYLVKPYTPDEFAEVVGGVLRSILADRKAALPVKGRDGAYRVRFDDFVYAETSNHDQVIHLVDHSTVATRSSSQALFDRLSHDSRFFKAGSSYILNLENVRALRDCECLFANGETVSVPARTRKALEDALFDYEFESM